MANIDEVLGGLRPQTAVARLCLRGDLLAQIEQVAHEADDAARIDAAENRQPQAPALKARLEELRTEAREAEVVFTFQAIGRRAWRELLAQHPPTAAQLELDAGLEYDPDTFPAAAIAAACVEPEGVTADAMAELEERLSIGQFGRLWTACLAANVQERATPK